MKSEYTEAQLSIIRKIAQIQIKSLLELQKNPRILHRRVKESKDRGFDEVTILDYYEDIAESWSIWERILEKPETFLIHRYFHNYAHIQFVLENSFTPKNSEIEAWQGLLKKLVLARNIGINQN